MEAQAIMYVETLRQISIVSALLTVAAITGMTQLAGLNKTKREEKIAIGIGLSAFLVASFLTIIVALIGMLSSITLSLVNDQNASKLNIASLGNVATVMGLLLICSIGGFLTGIVATCWTYSRWLGILCTFAIGGMTYKIWPIFAIIRSIWP